MEKVQNKSFSFEQVRLAYFPNLSQEVRKIEKSKEPTYFVEEIAMSIIKGMEDDIEKLELQDKRQP